MLPGLSGPENREVKACRWESQDKNLQHSGNQRGTWNGCRGVQEALFRLGTGVVCGGRFGELHTEYTAGRQRRGAIESIVVRITSMGRTERIKRRVGNR